MKPYIFYFCWKKDVPWGHIKPIEGSTNAGIIAYRIGWIADGGRSQLERELSRGTASNPWMYSK